MRRRPVRSYVRREGRITRAQQRALAELWPLYGVDPGSEALEWQQVFGRDVPTVMEIGFGNGHTLLQMAAAEPELNFVGVEVYRPGVGSLLLGLQKLGLRNVKVIMEDGAQVVCARVAPASLARIMIFFPDPWPKKRHHKRRLVQPDEPRLRNLAADGGYAPRPGYRPVTKYEQRGAGLGHTVRDLFFERVA
jgi:tRNA (guanine-N7-)-methyltransferase